MTISEKKRLIFEKVAESTRNNNNYIDTGMIAAGMGYLLKEDMKPCNFKYFIDRFPNWVKLYAHYDMPVKSLAFYFNEMCNEYPELIDNPITDKESQFIQNGLF